MKPIDYLIRFLGLGLKRTRIKRILEEFAGDSQLDLQAKKTAIIRILKSYFWVSNLSAPLVFIIGAVGFVVTFKSIWLWAACLLFVSLFTTHSTSEETLASKSFKVYKLFIGLLVVVSCYYSIRFDNTGELGLIHNLDFYVGSSIYIVGGAIALVTAITIGVEFFKTNTKFVQLQRLLFVICTSAIYVSSNYTPLIPYSLSYLVQALLTALLFAIALIKRKPALA